jgi:hypothetical protein
VRLNSLWFVAVGASRGVVTSMRGCDDSHAVEGFTWGSHAKKYLPTLYEKLVSCREEAHKTAGIR